MTMLCVQDKLKAVAAAGYTSFDTADIYGPSEGQPAWMMHACIGGDRQQHQQCFLVR